MIPEMNENNVFLILLNWKTKGYGANFDFDMKIL